MKPEESDQYKGGKIPLLQVSGNNMIKGIMEPERRVLASQRVGTRVEHAGSRISRARRCNELLSRHGCTHADSSLKLRGTISLQADAGMKPETTLQISAFQEIVILPMGQHQEEVVNLSSKRRKQFDPGG